MVASPARPEKPASGKPAIALALDSRPWDNAPVTPGPFPFRPSMRAFALLPALLAACLAAQEPLPYDPAQPGYHDAQIELARYCLEQGLVSECRRLCAQAAGHPDAAGLQKACEGRTDTYTAAAWGGFLDRREAVQKRRALAAAAAGHEARRVLYVDPDHAPSRKELGQQWHDSLGWQTAAEVARLAPLVVRRPAATDKAPHDATWEKPYVIDGGRFTLVTDLPWARALKYSALLERFDEYYFSL
ncbi:MAG: hypothetical protein KJ044_11520, partial [Planctomycetes bacterium]|nr:hypothetical protein [Planctomycetota bacterium]